MNLAQFNNRTYNANQPIGIFDSGLGGLSVLKTLKAEFPNESFIYLGDTARTPYGTKTRATVTRYAKDCAGFLLGREIKLLIVACNTASSYALNTLEEECPCPVLGMIEQAAKSAVAVSQNGRIGVIGTEATINSRAYEDKIEELDSSIKVFSNPCPLFVPLVEQGMLSGEIVEKIVELYLSVLKFEKIDTLLLGCTHFPLLSNAIKQYMGLGVNIVECSPAVAKEVKSILDKKDLLREEKAQQDYYFVTDEVNRFKYLARIFLATESVEAIRISSLG